MNRALLDTDILSEVLKARDENVRSRADAYESVFGKYTVSTISVVEIVKGLHKVRRGDRIRQIVAEIGRMELLTLDLDSAQLAGQIDGDLERTGQPIGRLDPMIAAIAIHHRLVLVTGNTNHYQRIQTLGFALELENWRR
jgi:tRNA(fMet)-specific endonuclease VapC